MRRIAVVVVAVFAASLSTVVPVRVQLTEDGRTIAGDLVGADVVVNAAGKVLEGTPVRLKAAGGRFTAQSLGNHACVYNSKDAKFTSYPVAEYPIVGMPA